MKLLLTLCILLLPLPPVAPYSHEAEVWVSQFCPEDWRPEIYPFSDPFTGKCTLKCVNQFCDLDWDDPRGHECDQVWIALPDTWDWSLWCNNGIIGETVSHEHTVERTSGLKHNRRKR